MPLGAVGGVPRREPSSPERWRGSCLPSRSRSATPSVASRPAPPSPASACPARRSPCRSSTRRPSRWAVSRGATTPSVCSTRAASRPLAKLDGFLSLAFFAAAPFTVDSIRRGHRRVSDDARGADERRRGRHRSDRTGRAVDRRVPAPRHPGRSDDRGRDRHGQRRLSLDESLASEVGVDLTRADVRRVEGSDETGHRFTRVPHATRRRDPREEGDGGHATRSRGGVPADRPRRPPATDRHAASR